jgi:hypothetical protein
MPVLDYDKGMVGFHRVEQQIASDALICRHWKVCKIFLSLFDMLLFNVCPVQEYHFTEIEL